MERKIIEHEIREEDPHHIHFHDSRVIQWDNETPVLSNDLMRELSDDDIEELYINLKIGFLVERFGISKCRKVFNEFDERC